MTDGPTPDAGTHTAAPRRRAASSAGVPPLPPPGAGNRALAGLLAPGARSSGPPADQVVQRDVVSDVEERMSYAWNDWEITDREAVDSLNQLARLTTEALGGVMGRLSQTAKSRLLDNMPAYARRSAAFTKILVAMGPVAVRPYIESLLSYGVFDWVITDGDADQVFRIFVALQPAQRTDLAQRLGRLLRSRLASNLARSSTLGDAERTALRSLFDATPDSEIETLKDWMHARFRIDFGTNTSGSEVAQEWDGPSLRRMYNVLQSLPPGAVESNPELARIDRYQDTGPAGGYYASDGRIAVGYGDVRARDGVVDASNPTGGGMSVVPGPLQGQNLFDGVVRHEVGHAVDRRLGLSQAYCIGNPAGGSWQAHDDGGTLAETLVTQSAGAVHGLPAVQRTAIVEALQAIIADRAPEQVQARLQALPIWARLAAATKTAVLADRAVLALQVSFADKTPGNPWYRGVDDGGINLGGRIYQEAYAGVWWSYDPAARARKVSSYQYRAPGEWIAEAYNAYYAPPTKGAKLDAVDHAAKVWFDVNVDQATGGEGAAGAGPALPAGNTGPGYP